MTTFRRGLVSAPHHLAAQAGAEVLAEGGNAVEAAVATAAALCVVYPHMTGLGGDGFWLVHAPGRDPVGIDACGRAGAAVIPEIFHSAGLDAVPARGPLAACSVAGAVSGWLAALDLARPWGRPLPLARLLEPAVRLAREGFPVSRSQHDLTASALGELSPRSGFADQFLAHGAPPEPGSVLRLPALADALERLGRAGLDDFYRGGLAASLAADLERAGSPLTRADLAGQRAGMVKPLVLTLPEGRVCNLPPPTQGLASLLILGLARRLGIPCAESFEHVHGIVEATKRAFAVRDRELGDPSAMTADPAAFLTPEALARLGSGLDMERAAAWEADGAPGDTVWFGTADASGRAASCIQSLYFEFGSGLVLPGSGVTWQNRACAFRLDRGGPRALAPGRKPFHTLNPALALLGDGRVLAYGAMGGDGQPQTQAAIYSRHVWFGQGLEEAVAAPRWLLGRAWGAASRSLKLEARFDPAIVEALRRAGHELEMVEEFSPLMGHAGAVELHPDGRLEGASDPRSDGAAAGC